VAQLAIRVADATDWPQIWPFFAQIVEAEETYAYPRGLTIETARPIWMEQIGAFGDAKRHPSDSDISVAFVGLVPHDTTSPRPGYTWFPMRDLPPVSPRQRVIVEVAMRTVQGRLEQAPVAFRLLPATFTLSDLQQMYELLLGKRLHKASFRRALQAAWLVEPTDEWRSEGRGRPAQLFRYAPKKRRRPHRGVRFDFLYP